MHARVVELTAAAPRPIHRARDPIDLRDPLLYAIAKAERANLRSLATPEQTLAEMVLKMRLVDVRQR
jgi:hypothetical protein